MSPSGGSESEMETDTDEIDENQEAYKDEMKEYYKLQEEMYEEPLPKYLIIKDQGGKSFSKSFPMKRSIWLKQALDVPIENIPIQREFKFESQTYISLEVANHENNRSQIEKLMKTKKLGPCKVEIIKDPRKNTIKGIVRDKEFFFKNITETFEGDIFKSKGILDMRRLGKEESRIYLITFDNLKIPGEIKFPEFGKRFEVNEYVPPPLKCFKCQKYGHPGKACRSLDTICQRCGENGHQYKTYQNNTIVEECNNEIKCFNCKGNHIAGSKECEIYKQWQKINEIVVLQKVDRSEAQKRILGRKQNNITNVFANHILPNKQVEENHITKKLEQLIETTEEKIQSIIESSKNSTKPDEKNMTNINTKLEEIITQMKLETEQKVANSTNNLSRNTTTEQDNIKEQVRKAVEEATIKIREESTRTNEENDKKFKKLEKQMEEQEKTIQKLRQTNQELENELKEKERELTRLRQKIEQDKKESSPKRKIRGGIVLRDSSENSQALIPPTQSNPYIKHGKNEKNVGKPANKPSHKQ